jgi:hypothetical protein
LALFFWLGGGGFVIITDPASASPADASTLIMDCGMIEWYWTFVEFLSPRVLKKKVQISFCSTLKKKGEIFF